MRSESGAGLCDPVEPPVSGMASFRSGNSGALGGTSLGRSFDAGAGAAVFAGDGRPIGSGGVGISTRTRPRAPCPQRIQVSAQKRGGGDDSRLGNLRLFLP